ncbi:MAG: hypothetical protein IKD92_04145 [Lachnospiraceae bacterium]|nr:hypothetical protein [Lachnospiraceae bacterium]
MTNHESRVCLSELVKGWFEGPSGNYMEKFADALTQTSCPGDFCLKQS